MESLKGNTYIHTSNGPTIGAYLIEDHLLVIDTGLDDSSIGKLVRSLGATHVDYIFNTHSHADHCGGNAYLQKRFKVWTMAPQIESNFITHPILEPIYLYGANPPDFMKHKFTMAHPSAVNQYLGKEESLTLNFGEVSCTFNLLDLKGHSPSMMGIITPDKIAFLGDALISEQTLEKHPLMFTYDVTEHLNTLEKLKLLEADAYVIAHGGYYEQVTHLIEVNKNVLLETQAHIKDKLSQGICTLDQLHRHLHKIYGLKESPTQYFLNRSVIKAHLAHLISLGSLYVSVKEGVLNFTSGPGA